MNTLTLTQTNVATRAVLIAMLLLSGLALTGCVEQIENDSTTSVVVDADANTDMDDNMDEDVDDMVDVDGDGQEDMDPVDFAEENPDSFDDTEELENDGMIDGVVETGVDVVIVDEDEAEVVVIVDGEAELENN